MWAPGLPLRARVRATALTTLACVLRRQQRALLALSSLYPDLRLDRSGLKPETNGVVAGFDNVTIRDHNQVMSRVGIADLKAHLSQHLRKVRGGRTLTILDRDTPVAQIVPYDAEAPLEVRRATRKPSDLRLPSPPSSPTNSLSVLLRDRASR